MQNKTTTWTSPKSHWVIPGPFKEDSTLYFDLLTGEAIYAQSDDVLTEADIIAYWDKVESADRAEARSFIDNSCFRAAHQN
eukprot:8648653-Pyramimonas_sp.AAC.1